MTLKGLSENKAKELLEKHGENTISSDKKIKPLRIFLGQFKDFMVMVVGIRK